VTTVKAGWAVTGACAFIAAIAVVYLSGLSTSPPYLMHDELQFSLQARSIAETGRDLAGRRFPVFFTEPEFPPGRDPVIVYVTAAALKVLPFSAAGVKAPTAIVGLLNILLMFGVGWALFGNPWLGLLAAALIAFTPIHFIRSRLVLSPFYSLPFILGWLVALAIYLRSGSRRALLSGTACVALSVYTYLACTVMAPIYFVITLWVAFRREGRQVVIPMIATAAIVLTPLLIWSATHPERYGQLIDAYRLYGAGSSAAPVLAPGTPAGPQRWIGLLWQFLNPDFLFLSGDSSLINSTRTAGLFPITFIALIACGVWAAARSTDTLTRVVLAGLVTSPLASLLSGAVEMNRIMFVIPFGVLMAAIGAVALLSRGGVARAFAILLLAAVPLQFASFHRYYTDEYPVRTGVWFGGNVRDAVIEASKGTGPVYLSERIPFVGRYWAFYAPRDREVRYFADPPASAATGARSVCRLPDPSCEAFRRDSDWRQVAGIRELSGEESFLIFEHR
jgi:4-amino-4-deoxy-L-arabinose transferase-like glycosyltransferase